MKFKDQEPIKLEIFQSDLEKIMYTFEKIIENPFAKNIPQIEVLIRIKNDFQHKIDIHKKRGDWL